MDSLSVLKAELTEARAKVSALENAINVPGGKSGAVSLTAQRLWFVIVVAGAKETRMKQRAFGPAHFSCYAKQVRGGAKFG